MAVTCDEPQPAAAAARHRRASTPRRPLVARGRRYDPETFGGFAEQFARFMGTARFLVYMTLFVVVWVGWNIARARTTCASTSTRSSS